MGKQYGIQFGALAPKLAMQLRNQSLGFDNRACLAWQRDADAIARLAVRQLLTEAETRRARGRLLRAILAGCVEAK